MLRRLQCSRLILLLMFATASQVSLAQLDSEEILPSEYVVRSVTPADRVHVVITKPRARIHLAKTYQPIARLVLEEDDTDYYDELPDLQIGYRRPELVNTTGHIVSDDLSDEVKLRLVLARKKALEAHSRNWG